MLILLAAAAQAASPAMTYDLTITRPADGSAPDVVITLSMQGGADGETELALPDEWGGEGELWRGVADLSVAGGVLLAADDATPAQRIIRHQPGARLTVSWRVIQDREGEPTAAVGDYYRPWIRPDYVHMIGHTIFLRPTGVEAGPVGVTLTAPQGWALASDIEAGADSLSDLSQSVIVAGDFRITTLDVAGERVAVRGDMDDAMIVEALEGSARGNLIYWEEELMDWPDPYWTPGGSPFLVTGLPLIVEEGRSSFGGTNLFDSFALFGTANTPADILRRILVHEHVHSWVPKRLGGFPADAGEERAGYWFSEGFTDFLTTRAGLLGGAWEIDEAIGQWNEFMAEYMASPVRGAPNTAIRDGFWSDGDLQRLPYLRGNLFAALVEYEIRTRTGGDYDLDDVLFAMRADPPAASAPEGFVDAVRAETGVDITALFERHILRGETIILAPDTFGACGDVETGEEPAFVYGMTLAPNPDGEGSLIAAVDPDGPAAGIFEPGMVILERVAGAIGDATRDSAFRVLQSGEEQVLSYRPTTGEMQAYQRLVPADAAGSDMECFGALAGRRLD